MKNLIILLFTFYFMISPAHAAINIFACEPEWAALAKEIGSDNVDVFSATRGTQDPHHISAKPSLLAGIRKADLLICTGGGLEVGWLPILMQNAGANLQPGQPGNVMASDHISLIGKLASVDRTMGDVHPEGNPHVQGNPANMLVMAKVMAERLSLIDPANKTTYNNNLTAFTGKWNTLLKAWSVKATSLRGAKIVTYHDSWRYLLDWLGMTQIASLEPKPGIPPTASHLDQVLQNVNGTGARIIILSPFDNDQAAKWLSGKTGMKIVRLPFTVGGIDNVNTLDELYAQSISLLKEASK